MHPRQLTSTRRSTSLVVALMTLVTVLLVPSTPVDAAPPQLSWELSGLNALQPDVAGDVGVKVRITDRGNLRDEQKLGVRLIITNDDGSPTGLASTRVTTAEGGTRNVDVQDQTTVPLHTAPFVPLSISRTPALTNGTGWDATVRLTLPEGDYRFEAEIFDATDRVVRRAGADRDATAAEASRTSVDVGVDVVYIATRGDFPDALAAAPVAVLDGAPVLLTRQTSLPQPTTDELKRLAPGRIVVLGGVNAIANTVVTQLRTHTTGSVTRIDGADRHATAANISRVGFPGGADTIYVANGSSFADGFVAAAAAARLGKPVLLVKKDTVPAVTVEAIRALAPTKIVIAGGTAIVTDRVQTQLEGLVDEVVRIAGADRYATAAGLIPDDATEIVVVTGQNFADALSAAPLAGLTGAALALTKTDDLPAGVAARLKELDLARVTILGGPTAVSNRVAGQLVGTLAPFSWDQVKRIGPPGIGLASLHPPTPTPSPTPTGTPSPTPTGSETSSPEAYPVSITSPTSAEPLEVTVDTMVPITFELAEPGTYSLSWIDQQGNVTGFVGDEAFGPGDTGTNTATVFPPQTGGTYSIRLDARADRDDLTGRAEQANSLIVAPATDPAPTVTIIAPKGQEQVAPGADLLVIFQTDIGGSYVVASRPSFPPGGAFVPFADGAATGTISDDTAASVIVTAPSSQGSYDLQVTVTAEDSKVGTGTEASAFFVTIQNPVLASACDQTDDRLCMLPFPNDHFTRPDPLTNTGRRIDFDLQSMPRNSAGKPMDPTEWNRSDGFSPGALIVASVPEVDMAVTFGIDDLEERYRDQITDLALSLEADAPIVLIDAETGERHPYYAEIDMHAEAVSPPTPQTAGESSGRGNQALLIRPSVNLSEGHRYIVALRRMLTASGAEILPDATFAAYRDKAALPGQDAATGAAARTLEFEALFTELGLLGVARDDLYLAWDFTVASNPEVGDSEVARGASIAGRALHIRDDAFAQLGDTDLTDFEVVGDTPPIVITKVTERGAGDDTRLVVDGHVVVPNYLVPPQNDTNAPPDRGPADPIFSNFPANPILDGYDEVAGLSQIPPGSRFNYLGPAGQTELPQQNPNPAIATVRAEFSCQLPRVATASDPAMPTLYGHGLLGGRGEARGSSSERLRERNHLICGVDWIGMASEDVANVAAILTDMGNFGSLTDRSQQGFLNFMFVGRALIHEDGALVAQAPDGSYPFREGGVVDGAPLITDELAYDGNSQGGILGGGLMALIPDARRGSLGVPGFNYSTLLNRSVDWEGTLIPEDFPGLPAYAQVMYQSYPDVVDRQLVFSIIQMLWDRSEGNGFAAHLTDDPLPNTPPHQILMHPAYGDYQVTNIAAEVGARSAGMCLLDHSLGEGRHWAVDPLFGFEPFTETCTSALVYWDSGNFIPPNVNIPPDYRGQDPHSDPRKDPLSGDQRRTFLTTGVITDVSPGSDYRTPQYPREPDAPTVG